VRAARLHELGGLPQVDELDAPAGSGTVAVSAASLNPVDISIGTGRFYGGTPELPYVIGSEAVGTTPDGRRLWVRGRELMAEVVDPAAAVWAFEVPEGTADGVALACGVAGLTAWLAVSQRAPVRAEDTVLVLGASGTLGSVAVQAAKLLGAGKVIGAARRVDRIPAAADETVDLAAGGELPAATLIIDALWGEPVERAAAAAERGARIVHLGQSAGSTANLRSDWVRGKMLTILGHSLFGAEENVGEAYRELCEHARDGRIVVDVETFALDDVAGAWERQASGSPAAKVVVTF
jgi:NADPH2:quinone reductase